MNRLLLWIPILAILFAAECVADRIVMTFELEVTDLGAEPKPWDPTVLSTELQLEYWYDTTSPKHPFKVAPDVVEEKFPIVFALKTRDGDWAEEESHAPPRETMAVTFLDNVDTASGIRDEIIFERFRQPSDRTDVSTKWQTVSFYGTSLLFEGDFPTSFNADEMRGLAQPHLDLGRNPAVFQSFSYEVITVPEPSETLWSIAGLLVLRTRTTRRKGRHTSFTSAARQRTMMSTQVRVEKVCRV